MRFNVNSEYQEGGWTANGLQPKSHHLVFAPDMALPLPIPIWMPEVHDSGHFQALKRRLEGHKSVKYSSKDTRSMSVLGLFFFQFATQKFEQKALPSAGSNLNQT